MGIIRHRALFAFQLARANQSSKGFFSNLVKLFMDDKVDVSNSFNSPLGELALVVYSLVFGSAFGVFLPLNTRFSKRVRQAAKKNLEDWGYDSDWIDGELGKYFENVDPKNMLIYQKANWENFRNSYVRRSKRVPYCSIVKTEEQFNYIRKDIKSPEKLKVEMLKIAKNLALSLGKISKKQQDYINALEKF